jgi:hypothetical protein
MTANMCSYKLHLRNKEGSIQHYFHFILGFLFPLVLWIVNNNIGSSSRLLIKDDGIMMCKIIDLFNHDIIILDDKEFYDATSDKDIVLDGYDDTSKKLHELTPDIIFNVRKYIWNLCSVKKNQKNNQGLTLIERVYPNSFYFSDKCEIQGSGTSRRSIENHYELKSYFKDKIPDYFRNDILDDQSIFNQVNIFSNTKILVGQHGAGLVNMLWMPAGSIVVELIPSGVTFSCFSILSELSGLRYFSYPQKTFHSPIDVKSFSIFISKILKGNLHFNNL